MRLVNNFVSNNKISCWIFAKLHMRTLLMQERVYSTYCSLKYLSGQGYLFQESQQSDKIAFYLVGWWKNRHTRYKKCLWHTSLLKKHIEKYNFVRPISLPRFDCSLGYRIHTEVAYKYATINGNGIKNSEVILW